MDAVRRKVISPGRPIRHVFSVGDAVTLTALAVFIYAGARLITPGPVIGPEIDLSPSALPSYTLLSLGRLTASYILSLMFSLAYGYIAAHSRAAERVMMPILDVLQSVPLLSFLPVVVLVLTTLLPQRIGTEAASIVLIVTCQVWNIAYAFYRAVRTLPRELKEASAVFRFNWWYRFRHVELPFGINGLLWNSVVSWANGWFFLMAAETFRVGDKDFRLLGLGSYLQTAADKGDAQAILLGFLVLFGVVVLLDQFVWQPLLAWAARFSADLTVQDETPTAWFFGLISRSRVALAFTSLFILPVFAFLDQRLGGAARATYLERPARRPTWRTAAKALPIMIGAGIIGFALFQIVQTLLSLPLAAWSEILTATISSTLRVCVALIIGLAWTVPAGVFIGINPRLASRLQPLVQIAIAVPATAFFPVLVLLFVNSPFGLDGAAVLLMVLGTQWYLLFNIIAGAAALPQNLKDVTRLFKIKGWAWWRTLILPALFPYIITGLNIAGGGAWNACIVAEYTEYNNRTYGVTGLGAVIGRATATGDYALLMAATLTMIITVIAINRFVWNRLHDLANERYRLD